MIFADKVRLECTPWNKAFGNKIVHLMYVVSLCHRHERPLGLPCKTDLDEFFEAEKLLQFESSPLNLPCGYEEFSAFPEYGRIEAGLRRLGIRLRSHSLEDALRLTREQFFSEKEFLEGPIPAHPFYVAGHFWHAELMPDSTVFENYLPLNSATVAAVRSAYPEINSPKSVAIHYRATDYSSHLIDIFPRTIMLGREYYTHAIKLAKRILGDNLVWHLFSDSPDGIMEILEGNDCVIHRGSAASDWVALRMARNVIQSNSTFCWTACCTSKDLSIQPSGGYNYWEDSGDIPFGFRFKNSYAIHSDGRITPPGKSSVAIAVPL